MKMKIITALTLIILLSACGGKGKVGETDVKILGLKGRVKSIKYSSFSAELKFGKVKKSVRSNSKQDNRYYYFNDQGVKIEDGVCNSYDQIQVKKLYRYNDIGKLIEVEIFDSEEFFIGKTIYIIDNKENLIEINNFNSKGEFIDKIIYIRDNKGNAIEKNIYDSIGSLGTKFKFEYDRKGRVLESIYYKLDDETEEKTYIKYDEKGRVLEIKKITKGIVIIKNYKYEMEEKDDVSAMIRLENYLVMLKTIYKYKYDKNGNWIQRISIEGGNPKTIEEREIEYYM